MLTDGIKLLKPYRADKLIGAYEWCIIISKGYPSKHIYVYFQQHCGIIIIIIKLLNDSRDIES